jgi:beta-lactam-binding protein with PASTA domain
MIKILINLAIVLAVTVALVLGFFYIYLPATTNHGETITVPDLNGMTYDQLEQFLTSRNLRYEVTDSSFSGDFPPLAVLRQEPRAGSKVKENRKIYVWLNAENPPKVKMPRLIDGSVKNAQMVLESYQLLLGDIQYVPDLAQNAVLEQWYNGKKIEEGTYVPKGSKIDLVVGDGLGNQILPVPNVLGMEKDEAEILIVGSGLKVGTVIYQTTNETLPGTIIKQTPPGGGNIRIGETVDIWVSGLTEGQEVDDKPIIQNLD